MQLKDIQHIHYRRFIFSVNDYFLAETINPDADINYCIQCPSNISGSLDPFYTLLIDLSSSFEAIREGIYHRTLSEINSFVSNQDFEHGLLQNLSPADLRHFIELFNAFAAQKKIRKAEVSRLTAYNKHGILAISYIRQKGQFICINFYRLTKARACNISSFIVKSSAGLLNNSHLGRAHRALHWLDIRAFKNAGVACYDLGGWYEGTADKDLLNINKFKEQFTKNIVKEYTGVIYKNKFLTSLLKRNR